MEAPNEIDARNCRHEERCSDVQSMSDDEGDVRRDDEEEEGREAKPARDPGVPMKAGTATHVASCWPYRSW